MTVDRSRASPCTSTASTCDAAGARSRAAIGRRGPAAQRRRHSRRAGVPHINHPNFEWAFTTDELQQVKNNKLFEIFNGHPQVNNLGGGDVPGIEEVWDRLLSNGDPAVRHRGRRRAHVQGAGQPDGRRSGPRLGGGPRGASRSAGDARIARARRLLRVHRRGLEDIVSSATAMTVKVKAEGTSKYRIQFVGAGGRILSEVARRLGDLHVQRGRRLRPRQSDREQRTHGLVPAGHGAALDALTVVASAFRRKIPLFMAQRDQRILIPGGEGARWHGRRTADGRGAALRPSPPAGPAG